MNPPSLKPPIDIKRFQIALRLGSSVSSDIKDHLGLLDQVEKHLEQGGDAELSVEVVKLKNELDVLNDKLDDVLTQISERL